MGIPDAIYPASIKANHVKVSVFYGAQEYEAVLRNTLKKFEPDFIGFIVFLPEQVF